MQQLFLCQQNSKCNGLVNFFKCECYVGLYFHSVYTTFLNRWNANRQSFNERIWRIRRITTKENMYMKVDVSKSKLHIEKYNKDVNEWIRDQV